MTFDITPIVEAGILLVLAIITVIVKPLIQQKVSAEDLAQIRIWIGIAVEAAEQLYQGSGRGREKKEYVLDWLAARGITLDADKLDAMVEAAVYQLQGGSADGN